MLSEVNGPVAKAGSTIPGSPSVTPSQEGGFSGFARPSTDETEVQSQPVSEQPSQDSQKELTESVKAEVAQAQRDFQYTAVKFSSSTKDTGFKFSIVDRETGRVLREFPPDEANKASSQGKLVTGKGLLHESQA